MRADVGAATIKHLLEEPSGKLTNAVEALGAGLAQSEGLDGDVPDSVIDAITKLKEIYAAVRQVVEDTYTSNSHAQDEVLAALTAMDVGLSEMQTGIIDGYGKPAEKALDKATRKMERAADALDKAAGRID
jgi:hypothetical protein